MAQGAIAMLDKQLIDALIISREYDRVRSTTDDQEQERCEDLDQYDLSFTK